MAASGRGSDGYERPGGRAGTCTVGCGLGDAFGRHVAAGAGHVLDHNRFAPGFGELVADHPRNDVGGTVLRAGLVMDHGWILTFAATEAAAPQISIATEGGSGTPVPDLSIEVDNLDEIHQRVLAAGSSIEYGPTREPWGVRRF
jgi:catechol 2,3-dioxygenase-like lactoylglutathione lyase family enzyme